MLAKIAHSYAMAEMLAGNAPKFWPIITTS
jgi:hypothetical protein